MSVARSETPAWSATFYASQNISEVPKINANDCQKGPPQDPREPAGAQTSCAKHSKQKRPPRPYQCDMVARGRACRPQFGRYPGNPQYRRPQRTRVKITKKNICFRNSESTWGSLLRPSRTPEIPDCPWGSPSRVPPWRRVHCGARRRALQETEGCWRVSPSG